MPLQQLCARMHASISLLPATILTFFANLYRVFVHSLNPRGSEIL
jgi:hypothetical protein